MLTQTPLRRASDTHAGGCSTQTLQPLISRTRHAAASVSSRSGCSEPIMPPFLTRRRRQHLALADMVGGADHAFGLHALDQLGGAVVADLEVALDKARRGLAFAAYQRGRLIVQLVARAALLVAAERLARRG